MIDAEHFRRLAEPLLASPGADETEVVLIGTDSSLTRFANSAIHQNVVERNAEVRVRAVVGTRVGVATTNDLSERSLERVARRAIQSAYRQPDNPGFPGLPEPSFAAQVDGFRADTAECTPERRAEMVRVLCNLAREKTLMASGALTTESAVLGVANSRGVFAHQPTSRANILTVMMDDEGSGYAERSDRSIDAIDAEGAAREAIGNAERGRGAISLEPGNYPVVLGEYAVAELLTYLAYIGFGALAYQEGTSFLRGKLGTPIVDERISIWDDGRDERGLPTGFDFEGVPKQRVDLVVQGVAIGVVYDSATAARDGRASTGHALPAPNPSGPLPTHLQMGAGETPKAELGRDIQRGLWISRFHYVNVVKSESAVLTGLTRDGTFLIENGEIGRPVKNLRFTQAVLDAWVGLGALGSERALVESWGGAVLVPAMRLEAFSFTGVSET